MRKRTLAALVGASALVVGVKIAPADTNLFVTEADFGGSQYAPGGSEPQPGPYHIVQNPNPVPNGQIKQTNWEGIGLYNSSTTGPLEAWLRRLTSWATHLPIHRRAWAA